MPVTLRDIAGKLNVSTGLVSRVLNNKPGVWVSVEKRERILVTAREMGYRPHAMARALGSGKSYSVAFVYRSPERVSPEQALVFQELASRLESIGYELLIRVVPTQQEVMQRLADLVQTRSCDAVVLWGDESEVINQGRFLMDRGIPFVAKGRLECDFPAWPQIDYAHEEMMTAAVHHVHRLGHHRIAYVGYTPPLVYRQRLEEGFAAAMAALAGSPSWSHVDSSVESAQAQMLEWLRLPADECPTAAVIGAGAHAWRGIELALASHGRRIGDGPGDFAVAGLTHGPFPLLFGEGHAFREIELVYLVESLTEKLLFPLLRGEAVQQPVVRVRPELRPVPSLNLLQYCDFRSPFSNPVGRHRESSDYA